MNYIHKEGYIIIICTIVILVMINAVIFYFFPKKIILYPVFLLSAIFLFLILNFFRNPQRNTPVSENNIIAPADGTLVAIEEVEENEYFKGKRLQVSIFMSPLNVHVNRNPVSGKVTYQKYHPGKYLVAWHPKSSELNERTTVVVKNNKTEILYRQIAGFLARRIICYAKTGDEVKQGQEFGFIKFGSRVDVFLPIGTKINVKLNEKIIGGETIIANI